MSFGYSVGDIVTIGCLAFKLYRAVRDAPAELREARMELQSLSISLQELEADIQDPDSIIMKSSAGRINGLGSIMDNCSTTLRELEDLVNRYQRLGEKSRLNIKRLNGEIVAKDSVNEIRRKLSFHSAQITTYLTTVQNSSLSRIEKLLKELMAEVKAGRRAPSVILTAEGSITTVDEDGDDFQELLVELEEEGIPKADLDENLEFILDALAGFGSNYMDGAYHESVDRPTLGKAVQPKLSKNRHRGYKAASDSDAGIGSKNYIQNTYGRAREGCSGWLDRRQETLAAASAAEDYMPPYSHPSRPRRRDPTREGLDPALLRMREWAYEAEQSAQMNREREAAAASAFEDHRPDPEILPGKEAMWQVYEAEQSAQMENWRRLQHYLEPDAWSPKGRVGDLGLEPAKALDPNPTLGNFHLVRDKLQHQISKSRRRWAKRSWTENGSEC